MSDSSFDDLFKTPEELLQTGKISFSRYNRLVRMIESEARARARAEKRAKFREAENYAIGSSKHPNVQGGLPSLGKRAK
jgi:hypothetical protein